MDSATRNGLGPVATAIRPLLNRLVFHGIACSRGLLDDSTTRVRSLPGAPSHIDVLATVAVDRLAADLIAAGLRRTSRIASTETWVYRDSMSLRIEASDTRAEADSQDAIAREFAVLLTRTIAVTDDCTIRVPGLPAQLALLWSLHVSARSPLAHSAPIEDLIEIVMRRHAIVDDVLAAPEELGRLVAEAARSFVADESSQWALRRALPDSRLAPGVITQAQQRFRRLAETYCA